MAGGGCGGPVPYSAGPYESKVSKRDYEPLAKQIQLSCAKEVAGAGLVNVSMDVALLLPEDPKVRAEAEWFLRRNDQSIRNRLFVLFSDRKVEQMQNRADLETLQKMMAEDLKGCFWPDQRFGIRGVVITQIVLADGIVGHSSSRSAEQ